MQPPPAVQGAVLAVAVAELGWTRVLLVGCGSVQCRAMADEFRRAADSQHLVIADHVELPQDLRDEWNGEFEGMGGTEQRKRVLDALGLDACVARIIVLCLDTALAAATVEAVRASGHAEQFVLLGSETASRVQQPLPGMFAIRLTATPAWHATAQVLISPHTLQDVVPCRADFQCWDDGDAALSES